jgi:hypothetical protein
VLVVLASTHTHTHTHPRARGEPMVAGRAQDQTRPDQCSSKEGSETHRASTGVCRARVPWWHGLPGSAEGSGSAGASKAGTGDGAWPWLRGTGGQEPRTRARPVETPVPWQGRGQVRDCVEALGHVPRAAPSRSACSARRGSTPGRERATRWSAGGLSSEPFVCRGRERESFLLLARWGGGSVALGRTGRSDVRERDRLHLITPQYVAMVKGKKKIDDGW